MYNAGMRPAFPLCVSALAIMVLNGCGPDPAPDIGAIGRIFDPIIGGTLDTSTPQNDAVLMITFPVDSTHFAACTGTLIAPNVVLTARHCVSNTNDTVACNNTDVKSDIPASGFEIFKGVAPNTRGTPIATVKQVYHDGSKNLCGHDLAILVTNERIASSVAVPKKVRVTTRPKVNELFKSVGYGLTNPDAATSSGKRYYRENVKVLGAASGTSSRDFTGTESICSGDSGGPALSANDAVFGVTSRGPQGCTNIVGYNTNVWTSTDVYKALIDQAVSEAGSSYTGEDGTVYPSGTSEPPDAGPSDPADAGQPDVVAPDPEEDAGPEAEPSAPGDNNLDQPCAGESDTCPGELVCRANFGSFTCVPRCSAANPQCPDHYDCAINSGVCVKASSCGPDDNCAPGLVCVEDRQAKYCTPYCGPNGSCPMGYNCQNAGGVGVCARTDLTGDVRASVSCATGSATPSSPSSSSVRSSSWASPKASWLLVGLAALVAAARRRKN